MFKMATRVRRAEFVTGMFAAAAVVGLLVPTSADARWKRYQEEDAPAAVAPQPPKPVAPLTMMVSLKKQRMYVYDQNGLVTQSRVSTGMPGYDTPKGIYSIIEKDIEHTSNIYEGASMPYMQRLLQTGIAMHAGVVPGYPASHGCIRLPFEFAPKLFEMTTMNERVIVTPDVQAPVSFAHPFLFEALPKSGEAQALLQKTAATESDMQGLVNGAPVTVQRTRAAVAEERAKMREALLAGIDNAKAEAQKLNDAIPVAVRAADDARIELRNAEKSARTLDREQDKAQWAKAQADKSLRWLEKQYAYNKARVRADKSEAMRLDVEAARVKLEQATSAEQAATLAAKAADKAADEARAKVVAADQARVKAKKAAGEGDTQIAAAKKALDTFNRQEGNRGLPITVLISAKTGKISLRQGWEMLAEAPVTIENPSEPLGTYLFTATTWQDDNEKAMKWTVATVGEANGPQAEPDRKAKTRREREQAEMTPPPASDPTKATAALSRVKIPEDMQSRIAEIVKPGSVLIVSDFDMSRSETRYGTDLIVQMPEVVARITEPTRKRYSSASTSSSSGWSFYSDDNVGSSKKSKKSYYYSKPAPSPKWGFFQ